MRFDEGVGSLGDGPDEDDPNAFSASTHPDALDPQSLVDDANFDDYGFDGDEDGLSRGEGSSTEQAGCSLAPVRTSSGAAWGVLLGWYSWACDGDLRVDIGAIGLCTDGRSGGAERRNQRTGWSSTKYVDRRGLRGLGSGGLSLGRDSR